MPGIGSLIREIKDKIKKKKNEESENTVLLKEEGAMVQSRVYNIGRFG